MRRILIVDDEQVIADTLRLIFTRDGFDARVAYSAKQAMVCARSFHPDLLLCDVNMPQRDGLDLVCDLLQEQPACRVIILTGSHPSASRAFETARHLARPMPILLKPCTPGDLLREAEAVLKSA